MDAELRVVFLPLASARGGATSALAGLPPAAAEAVAADNAPLKLLQLQAEVLVLVLFLLDAQSLARVAATCLELYRDKPRPMMTPVEETRGRALPERLPLEFSSWAVHLTWF